MKIILSDNKIKPRKRIFGLKIASFLKAEATLRSFNSMVVDLIPLNQRGIFDCTRSERID